MVRVGESDSDLLHVGECREKDIPRDVRELVKVKERSPEIVLDGLIDSISVEDCDSVPILTLVVGEGDVEAVELLLMEMLQVVDADNERDTDNVVDLVELLENDDEPDVDVLRLEWLVFDALWWYVSDAVLFRELEIE